MIPIKNLDICKTTEKYILQQCNCLTTSSWGLAKTIELHFKHVDIYSNRRRMKGTNYAVPNDRSIPGTVTILEGEDHSPSIICLYGQYRPGKSISNYGYPSGYPDTTKDRLRYFEEGLDGLLDYFEDECAIIAVPFTIGCGLARRKWDDYLRLLQNFHSQLKKNGGGLVFYKI